jgi:hypothetical protein
MYPRVVLYNNNDFLLASKVVKIKIIQNKKKIAFFSFYYYYILVPPNGANSIPSECTGNRNGPLKFARTHGLQSRDVNFLELNKHTAGTNL